MNPLHHLIGPQKADEAIAASVRTFEIMLSSSKQTTFPVSSGRGRQQIFKTSKKAFSVGRSSFASVSCLVQSNVHLPVPHRRCYPSSSGLVLHGRVRDPVQVDMQISLICDQSLSPLSPLWLLS